MIDFKSTEVRTWIWVLLLIALAANAVSFWRFVGYKVKTSTPLGERSSFLGDNAHDTCNIAAFDVHGVITTYWEELQTDGEYASVIQTASEDTTSMIKEAMLDPLVEGILIEIDSGGGYPVASQEIADLIKNSEKPVVALIRGVGLSGGYWVATGAEWIIASAVSEVGSIGVTSSYIDYGKFNDREGITYNSIRSAPLKDYASQEKALSAQERAFMQRNVNEVHDFMVEEIALNRNMEIPEISRLADGSSMTGLRALQVGLVDALGSYDEVEDYFEKKLGIEPDLCWGLYYEDYYEEELW